MKRSEFNVKINTDAVLRLVDCDKDSPLYDSISEELKEILPLIYEKLEPVVIYETGSLRGISEKYNDDTHEALFVIISVGKEISNWSSRLFTDGRYMAGMLVDAAADDYLFRMESEIADIVKEFCGSRNKGICAKLEAPRDIPMTAHKIALEVTGADISEGIQVTESYMFDPVKTMCRIYVLDDNTGRFDIDGSCARCPDKTCNLRDVYI